MASSLPVRCTCWSSKETIRASRLTANLPVRIVGSGWSPERPTIAGIELRDLLGTRLNYSSGKKNNQRTHEKFSKPPDPPQHLGVERRIGCKRFACWKSNCRTPLPTDNRRGPGLARPPNSAPSSSAVTTLP
jgi:hypothetical protein